MIVESFLIFLTTLISLNTPAETQAVEKTTHTTQANPVVPPAPAARGGWDHN